MFVLATAPTPGIVGIATPVGGISPTTANPEHDGLKPFNI